MTRLNLIPPEQLRGSGNPWVAFATVTLIVGFAATALHHHRLADLNSELRSRIAASQHEIASSTARLSQQPGLEERRGDLQKRVDAARGHQVQLQRASCQLARLVELLPGEVTLAEIAGSDGKWRLSGESRTSPALVEFLDRLTAAGVSIGSVEVSEPSEAADGAKAPRFRVEAILS